MSECLPWHEVPGENPDDRIRKLVPPTEYTFVGGQLALKAKGLVILCDRVIDRTLQGNVENARILKSAVEAEWPHCRT